MQLYKNIKINKITAVLLCITLCFFTIKGMEEEAPNLLQKGNVPPNTWSTIHVVPLVKVENSHENKGALTKYDTWYCLFADPKKSDYSDVLVAAKKDVEPRTFFGRSVATDEKDIFLQTVYNTLERCTNKLYTRKDYKYYYMMDRTLKLPPYVIMKNSDGASNDLYVFVNLQGKKTDEWLNAQERRLSNLLNFKGPFTLVNRWSSKWNDFFGWVDIGEDLNELETYGAVHFAIKDSGAELKKLFDERDNVLSQNSTNEAPALVVQPTSNKATQGSWLSFADALYFNNRTPGYSIFSPDGPLKWAPLSDDKAMSDPDYAIKIDESLQELFKNAAANKTVELAAGEGVLTVKDLLLSTGDRLLIYADKKANFLGIGPEGTGQNKLGLLLMDMRDRLSVPGKAYSQNQPYRSIPLHIIKEEKPQVTSWTLFWRSMWYRLYGTVPETTKAASAAQYPVKHGMPWWKRLFKRRSKSAS